MGLKWVGVSAGNGAGVEPVCLFVCLLACLLAYLKV